MSKYTRGEFLGFGAVLAGAFTLGRIPGGRQSASAQQLPPPPAGAEPDLMVVNGVVYTSDPAQPRAEAFAVKNGRFVAVGSSADIRNLATRRTQVLDAQRMTVTPGFIDAHCHPSGVEELYGVNTNLRTVREIQSAIRQKAETTAPELWITGFMFDDTKPDPPDGRFFRDEKGSLNGRVAENPRNVFARVGKRETFTPEQRRDRGRKGMAHMSKLFNAAGLTTVHN